MFIIIMVNAIILAYKHHVDSLWQNDSIFLPKLFYVSPFIYFIGGNLYTARKVKIDSANKNSKSIVKQGVR